MASFGSWTAPCASVAGEHLVGPVRPPFAGAVRLRHRVGPEPLERVDETCWRIPKSYKQGMRVDGLIFASEVLLEQIKKEPLFAQWELVRRMQLSNDVTYQI